MPKDVKTKSAAGMLILIVLATVVILNLISINLFSRADLTDDNIYSLAESSREIVAALNDRLTVKAYITDDLPAPHNGDARYLKDLLDDYRAYSHGYIHYEFIDPAKENKEEEAMGYRIPPLQFNVFRNDKTEFIKGYKGVVLIYGDKQEVLPFIENTNNLEYDLSRAIMKLTSAEIPKIGFTMGNGEPDMSEGLQTAYQILQKEFRVQFMNLENLKYIPEDIQALFVVAPESELNDWELYLIDQFIMRGGRVAFLLNRFAIDIRQGLVTPIDNGLDKLLNSYGIGLKEQIVVDPQCNMIPVTRDMGQFQMQSMVRYPFYLAISSFNPDISIVKDIKRLDVLFISPLDLDYPTLPETDRQVLFSSSEQSGKRGLPVDISPEKRYEASDFTDKNLPLGAVLTGKFTSFYKNHEKLPEYVGPDTLSETPIPAKIDSTLDSRIVVIGNGAFVTDDYRRNAGSFVVMLNIADWMTQDKGLISIRSKQVTARTLKVISDGSKRLVKYTNMLGMPLVVVLLGLIRWQFKRSTRRARSV
ncbi:MAG: GldG family protein [Candidatus Zixiibacteriota bacterium]|nr:MAG: GldG family protein [candidate division Zixibacteria bacterium]